jgi:hypothetical protein
MIISGEQTFEMQITEEDGKGRISRKVVVKNGQVIEKPSDVNILGENTSEGFVVSGLEIVRKRRRRL